jgi:hypothetical protein
MQGSARVSWPMVFALAAVTGLPARAIASHHVFSYSVDRFEVDGNVFGPVDGTLDYVDEFDNGTIVPDWVALLGTNLESGGVVTLKNPGTDYTIGGVSVDVSNIENEDAVANGSGDFTATAYWLPSLALTDQEFHFQLYELGPVIESVGLSVGSASAAVPPAIIGPSISQALTQISGTYNTLAYNTISIDPNDVTGQIVLRISFDDASNTVTNSFSLDGGTTFQSPFPALPAFVGVSEYEFLLGAGVIEGPPPAGTPTATPTPAATPTPTPLPTPQMVGLRLLMVKNPSGPAFRKIVYKVKDFGHTVAGNPLASGATWNLKLDDMSQCFSMPAAGWSAIGSKGFKYVDSSALYGAVRKARIKKSGNVFSIKAIVLGGQGPVNIVPPNPGVQADTNLSFGNGAEYCSSTAGAALGPNSATTFKAKGALAPATCNVPACPP